MNQTMTTLSTEERLTLIAEAIYVIEPAMCLNRRQQMRTNRIVWVRRMVREFAPLSTNMLNKVLNELETTAGIKPELPKANETMGDTIPPSGSSSNQ